MRNKILGLVAALLLALPGVSVAADGDAVSHSRNGLGYGVDRYLLCDADTGTGTCTKTVPTTQVSPANPSQLVAYDFARYWVEEGDTCTSWSITVRDYPLNSGCRGTCDPHDVADLTKGGNTSVIQNVPLGEAFDADITAISCSGGVSVYLDLYHRSMGEK